MRSSVHRWSRPRLYSAAIVWTVLIALLAGAGLAASAVAATYTVGTTNDTGGGACSNPASGTCSLRELVAFENARETTPNPPDIIAVPAGSYSLTGGELTITKQFFVVGAGARTTHVFEPGGSEQRVFKVETPNESEVPPVLISGLEISGGTANANNGSFGGDVYNSGQLLLLEDWITEGTASSGGGISNDTGVLVLVRSLVSNNHAATGGGDSGAIQNHGSAICSTGCVPGKGASLAVEASTIADNDARLGGGIFSWTDEGVADENQVSIVGSTIADNSVQQEPGGAALGPGGGLLVNVGTAVVATSMFAFNHVLSGNVPVPSNCVAKPGATITSIGYNLETQEDCGFKATGDIENTLPTFTSASPQNNGGNTDTLEPLPGSPGVDAIPTSFPLCGGVDQRGVTRPQGSGCDMGAVELGSLAAPPVVSPPSGRPVVIPASPTIVTSTSAAFTTTVNPQGLATSVHFEYGPVLGGSAAAITYSSSTPPQIVGSDFTNHTVTATVTGLLPNVVYHVRAVATNSAGSALGADQTLKTPSDPLPPPPVLGKSVNVSPVSGVVYIELPPGAKLYAAQKAQTERAMLSSLTPPAQAFEALAKGQGFIPLTEARQIPVGSTLDTSAGVARIATATARKGKLQSGDFGAGIFKLLQQRKQRGLTELDIVNNSSSRKVCATVGRKATAAKLSSKVLGRLHGSAHGRFTTRGQYSAATVRGTIWGVTNQCNGTLTRVQRDVVTVRDFRRRKTITLFSGQSYLARAPGA